MPDGEFKIGNLQRDLPGADLVMRKSASEPNTRTLSFSASSEMPVERWFGTEVLSHDASAVRLDRVRSGAVPLLFNHNWADPIGMIDQGAVRDGRLMVDAHLFDTARAQDVAAMVDGGLRNVSVGYRIHVIEEDKKTGVFTARDWQPMEISIVTVPADPSIGIGRAQDEQANTVQVIRTDSPTAKTAESTGVTMTTDVKDAPAGVNAEDKQPTAMEFERQRKEAIVNLCKANSIDERVQIDWITRGTSLDVIAKEILDIQEERNSALTSRSAVGLSRKETNQYSIVRALRSIVYGAQDPKVFAEAAFERECSEQVQKQTGHQARRGSLLVPAEVLSRPVDGVQGRTMTTIPGGKGGYAVDTTNMDFLSILRNRSVALRMGARQLQGLTGNVFIPRQTGKASVTWQGGEGTTVSSTDQALGQLSMAPKTAIAKTDVSEQLLRQMNPSAESFIMGDLAAVVAIDGIDNAVINGTGGAQPLGIKNTTGITSGQDAASVTYAKVLAFVSTAGALNAIRGNPGFVTTTAGAAKLMQTQRFTSTDTPVWTGNMFDGQLVGFNAMSSEQLASGNLIFGSWDEVVIGDWGVLELSTDSGGTRFDQGIVGIRALWMVDVLVRYPQCFVVSVNLS